ncbi:MAG: DUF3179 domain-containing (seleno)protein [Agriterribacter sp.]
MKRLLLIAGLIFLFAIEILRIYFIMPFPGSQHNQTIDIAYWLGRNIWWLRVIGLLIILTPCIKIFKSGSLRKKIALSIFLLLYGLTFFMFTFRFEADKMFYQPKNKNFANASANKIALDKLILGIQVNGEAKAYPIQLIGYHHQVKDTVGNIPVIVTYCTVCRTGRVYSPVINGSPENFRLVGMDHFNAMFEDATTKSWWQQATGKAIAGKLKGSRLQEIPSAQSTLASWLIQYPQSAILQPDTLFNKKYENLAEYDKGTLKSNLEKRDSGSWQFKSWVIGIQHLNISKAYDWNKLLSQQIIQDSLPGLPVLIGLEKDSMTFHVFNRAIKDTVLTFEKNNAANELTDIQTHSIWNMFGQCIEGALKGKQLQPIQAYQEFWHSWQTFHPQTKISE